MISKLLIAGFVMALCVVIHAAGVAGALRWWERRRQPQRPFGWIVLLVAVAAWIIFLHLAEISAWALLYFIGDAMPDLPSAFYFSGVTYTTTGYGDLVLEGAWRLVGGVEALTGILMCGWSTGFFFAIVGRITQTMRPTR